MSLPDGRVQTPAVILLCLSLLAAPERASASADPVARELPEPVPGEFVIELARGSVPATAFRFGPGGAIRTGLAELDARLAALGATALEPAFDLSSEREAKRAAGLDRFYRVRYRGPLAAGEAVRRFAGVAAVAGAQPNQRTRILLTPNDPLFPSQWAHQNTGQAVAYGGGLVGTPDCDTDTPDAWNLETGDPSVIIAILDTGVDTGHPEFAGRVVPGWDFVNGDADASDDHGHGTACAAIALGAGHNAQGIAGVAWGARLMPVKVMAFDGFGSDLDLANGITFAADQGARILSMSLGGFQSAAVNAALDYAVNTKGCVPFAAAGNSGAPFLDYPAQYIHCLGVGALSPCNQRKETTTCDGEAWWASNYGVGLAFLAPGVRIHTADIRGAAGLDPGDYLATFNGTSSATPHAAGIGALVWSRNPALSPDQVRQVLINSCDNLGPAGWDGDTGYGRLNAYAAVQLAAGTSVMLFSETFEGASVPGAVWSASDANGSSGLDTWGAQTIASGARAHAGQTSAYCAHNASPAGQAYDNNMTADLTLVSPVNVSGHTNVRISFWKWFRTAHSSDYLSFQYWNGSAWAEHQRWMASDAAWRQHTFDLSGFTSYRFRFVFVSNGSKTSEGAYIDDIVLTGVPTGSALAPVAAEVEAGLGRDAAPAGPVRALRALGNPFARETALEMVLPRAGAARLEVYSVTGRRVAVLADGPLSAGRHTHTWAGRAAGGERCAPGVYFARAVLDGVPLATERLVLLP